MVMTWGWLIMEFTACIINYMVYGHPRLGILTMAFKKSSWIPVNGLMIPQNGCITHELTMAHIALACLSCIDQVDPLATKKNDRIMARCSENCLLLHVSDHIFHLADLRRDIGGNWHQATSVPCNPQISCIELYIKSVEVSKNGGIIQAINDQFYSIEVTWGSPHLGVS